MLEVPVYNTDGEQVETLQVDESLFGGRVNAPLLKQAIVAYQANRHRRTAATKTRAQVIGSTRKLYRQKGTGYARRGAGKTHVNRGGGMAFAKGANDSRKKLPRKMRRRALDSAILAKMLGNDLLVVDGLSMDAIKTKQMAAVLKNLKINRSCLLTLAERDRNIHLSARNIADLTVRIAEELNAYEVAMRRKLLVTKDAMQAMMTREGEE